MEKPQVTPLTIYVPSICNELPCLHSDWLLFGCTSPETSVTCVTAFYKTEDTHSCKLLMKSKSIYPVGLLINEDSEPDTNLPKSLLKHSKLQFTLYKNDESISGLRCVVNKTINNHMDEVTSTIVIFYDLYVLRNSNYFLDQDSTWCSELIDTMSKTNSVLCDSNLLSQSLCERISNCAYRGVYHVFAHLPCATISKW